MSAKKPEHPRILVVDDDSDHLALVGRWLSLEGLEIACAESGESALAALEAKRPDLVITDLVMNGIDGIRLLREIHRHDPVMPVIVMSGQAGIPDAVKATHLGASAFLTKPLRREALVEEVKQALTAQTGRELSGVDGFAPKMVHRSQIMAELLSRARLVAGVTRFLLYDRLADQRASGAAPG